MKTIKKLTLCILCFANAANLATDEDFNNENSSNSEVEENSLINKNNWNTRKWGNLYFLFPHLSFFSIFIKIINGGYSCRGKLKDSTAIFLNFIFSGVIEYKYMFHKYWGINVRLNLNKIEGYSNLTMSFFSFELSLEWIYRREGKHIFSGSFSPLELALVQKDKGSLQDNFTKKMWVLCFVLLKYEYDRRFYLNFGNLKTSYFNICSRFAEEKSIVITLYGLLSIEFGLNIIGVNDYRKKKKMAEKLL